jgi:hypothetical protein
LITPRGAGSQHPEHAVEGRPVIVPFSATFLPGHQTFDQVPLTVFQFITSHRVLRDASYFDNKKQNRDLTCAELVIRQTTLYDIDISRNDIWIIVGILLAIALIIWIVKSLR